MACDVAKYKQARYEETTNEMKNMLINVGWKKYFIEKNTPTYLAGRIWRKDLIEKNTPILPLRTDRRQPGQDEDGRGGWRAQEPGWWLNARPRSAPPGTWTSTS